MQVGQLHEVLVTADGLILDGRERYELMQELGMEPRVHYLTMHSGQGPMPPGYELEQELEECRQVIAATQPGKWTDHPQKRLRTAALSPEAERFWVERLGAGRALELKSSSLAANPVGVRLPPHIHEFLAKEASLMPKLNKGPCLSSPELIRLYCFERYWSSQEA